MHKKLKPFLSVAYFVIMLTLLFQSHVYGQFFKAGILIGANGSQITGDNMVGFNKGGLLVGTFVEHDLDKNSSLRMEMVYNMKGSADNKSNPDPNRNWDLYRVSYLEIPFIYDYLVYDKYGFCGGLAIGFTVNEFYRDFNNTEDPSFTIAKKMEGSYLLGGFYEHSDQLEFFLRYQSSLLNFSTANNTPFFQLWGQRRPGYLNVLASFGIRYYFRQK